MEGHHSLEYIGEMLKKLENIHAAFKKEEMIILQED